MSYYTNVRYGKMRMVGRFKTERDDLRARDRCIVRTDRGKEIGEVLSPLEALPETLPPESLWDILRRAHADDIVNVERLEKENIPRAVKECKELILKLNLRMKLVDVDYILGGERIIFYFTSTARVDFRELVRLLAHEFRTRIELKQVGARDEARLIGDAGHCGLTLCCRSHLKELGGITMDMAKIQKHTADPSKITGRCGKLLCCLRYEYSLYTEARDVLPQRGRMIDSPKAKGVVVEQNMLLREVTVEIAGGDRVVVRLEEIVGSAPPSVAGCSGCDKPAKAREELLGAPPAPAAAIEHETPIEPSVPVEPTWIKAAKTADIPPGARKMVRLAGTDLAIFNVAGSFHVLANDCPHQGGSLAAGSFEGTIATCPLHRWEFDVTSGKSPSISGAQARTYECKVEGDDVVIKI